FNRFSRTGVFSYLHKRAHECTVTWSAVPMKKCTWCGKEYPDTVERCLTDAEPLIGGEPPPPMPVQSDEEEETIWSSQLIDLSTVAGGFEFREGFSRPNWK